MHHGVQVEEAQARAEEDRQRREGQQCVPMAPSFTFCCRVLQRAGDGMQAHVSAESAAFACFEL